jgi:hypothetical protein
LIDGGANGQPGGNAVAILSSGGVKVDAVTSPGTSRRTTEPLSTMVDALLERNSLAGINRTIRRDLDHGLLREARE